MKSKKSLLSFISLIFCSILLVACSDKPAADLTQVMLQGKTMGTTYSVKFFATEKSIRSESYYKDIEAILETVNDQMSTYRKDSELSRFNRYSGEEPFIVSGDTAKVVRSAIEIGKNTGGVLDVTVGPLVNLWGFGPNGQVNELPSDEDIQAARSFVGLEKLSVDGRSLIKQHAQLYVDLSAIAKGFGVDKVAEYLDEKNVASYLVEIGGEMKAKGKKLDGVSWSVAIEKPTTLERSIQQILPLDNIAIATSGDYRNYYEKDGKRFSHTIDPITGKPIEHNLASVTVLHQSTMMADGYATAMNVMGSEKALKFADDNKLAVYLVVKSANGFEVLQSKAFESVLK